MTSAVEQAGVVGCFVPVHDASKLRVCFTSPLWFQDISSSDCNTSDLPSKKPCQVAISPVEGTGKDDVTSESASKSEDKVAMPHWMNSDQAQGRHTEGHTRVEMTPDVAPSTPMQSFPRQKPQPNETPESSCSLPSLALGIGSLERPSGADVDLLHGPRRKCQSSFETVVPNSQQIHSQQLTTRSIQFATSTPSKNLNRIQLEVQREGLELHKENLLSLSLPKHERGLQLSQKSDPSLSLGHYVGQPPPQRILASLAGSKVSPAEGVHAPQVRSLQLTSQAHKDDAYIGSSLSLDSSPLQLPRTGRGRSKASSTPALPGYSDFVFESRPAGFKQFPEAVKSATLSSSIPGEAPSKGVSRELSLEMKSLTSSMDAQNLFKIHSEMPPSRTGNHACTSPRVAVKQDLSLADQLPAEGVRYMQLLPGALDFNALQQQTANDEGDGCVDSHDSGSSGKRRKSSSSQNEGASGSIHEQRRPNVLVIDIQPYHREAKKPTRKKRQAAAERPNTSCCAMEVTDTSAQWYGQPVPNSQRHVDHLQEYTRKHNICVEDTECKDSILSTWRESTEMQAKGINAPHEEMAASRLAQFYTQEPQNNSRLKSSCFEIKSETSLSAPDVARYPVKESSDAVKGGDNVQSVGLKLFTTPAYAQMPNALSTFSAGEPSLPLSLELSQKLPDSVRRKTPTYVEASTDADWGKFLALSATPVVSIPETDGDTLLPYQQRFKQLQAFLKQCDESDPKERLQALRSLSAAARSGHAVELETRAIRLSLEEGKEMNRMKMLNVLGRNAYRNPNDAGATPHGPRLPAPGATSTLKLA